MGSEIRIEDLKVGYTAKITFGNGRLKSISSGLITAKGNATKSIFYVDLLTNREKKNKKTKTVDGFITERHYLNNVSKIELGERFHAEIN